MRSPLIVLGMHRSGTRMLTRHLHRNGVFMGWSRNAHFEASFFVRRNKRLFRLAGARWDQPLAAGLFLENENKTKSETARFNDEWKSQRALSYLGPRNMIRREHIEWGFKDPRTVFTVEFWLQVFPGARLIVIDRHGVDVAASLRYRERNRRAGDPLASQRCLDLNGGFELWCEYVGQAAAVVSRMPPEQVYRVRYEDYLDDPVKTLTAILAHFSLPIRQSRVQKCAAEVKPGRNFAFLQDPELAEFNQLVCDHPLMRSLGYNMRDDKWHEG